jgi:hypothetical protein
VEEKLRLLAESANKTKNLRVPSQTNDTDPPKVDLLEDEDSWSDDDEDWSDDEQENNHQSETVGKVQSGIHQNTSLHLTVHWQIPQEEKGQNP